MRRKLALLCATIVWSGCFGGDGADALEPLGDGAISITPASTAVMTSVGDTRTVSAVVMNTDAYAGTAPPLSWSTNAPTVATVAGTGTSAIVTAVGEGTAIIKASNGSAEDTVTVTVRQRLVSFELAVADTFIVFGDTTRLTVIARDARNNEIAGLTGVTYASKKSQVATVSPAGTVTGVMPFGTTELSASVTRGGDTASDTLRITSVPPSAFDFASLIIGEFVRPASTQSAGTGVTYFTLEGNRIRYRFGWSELSGPAVSAHIHGPSTTAQTGDVLVDFAISNETANYGVRTGFITPADIRPQGGALAISLDSLLVLMNTRSAYVDVHTASHGEGEIRGVIDGPFRSQRQ